MKSLDRFKSVRILWSLSGGLWGAWMGFRGYFGLTQNADSFGGMFALAFFIFFAFLGFIVGITICWLLGRSTELLLRRLGVSPLLAILIATLVTGFGFWQIGSFVQEKYPGLSGKRITKISPSDANAK